MHKRDRRGVFHVPRRQLSEFANALFSFLYYYHNMQRNIFETSDHFKDIIGRVVFCIERATYELHTKFVSKLGYVHPPPRLCEEVCSSYPNDDYFKKLYYVSAFILHYATWRFRILLLTDFNMGPKLWVRMFRKNFESQFEQNGGWQGFVDAGEATLDFYISHWGNQVFKEQFLPDTILGKIAGNLKIPRDPEEIPEDFPEFFERMSLRSAALYDAEWGNFEYDQPAQVDEDINPLSVKIEEIVQTDTSEESEEETEENTQKSLSRTNPRKRRGPTAKDSNTEPDVEQVDVERKPLPVSPERKKVQIVAPEKSEERIQKTPRKRRHESTTKDSGKEEDSPSSSKPKVDPES